MRGILHCPLSLLGMVVVVSGCGSKDQPRPIPVVTENQAASGTPVEVEVIGFENDRGHCRVAAYDSSMGFQNPEKAIARSVLPIEKGVVRWTLSWQDKENAPHPGMLAISAYHDQNDNGQLDKNLLGLPTERYGFSNNPKRGYGPPTFEQAAMTKPEESSHASPWRIEIKIQ